MNLKEKSIEISKELLTLQQELEKQKADTIKALDEMTEEFKAASAQGDRSENAAFSEATSKLSMYNVTLSTIDARLKSIKNKVNETKYTSIGLVTLYSTVHLQVDSESFICKLYPEGVSDINKGIVSIDGPLGKALMLKEKGDTVILENNITGEPIKYKIVDIY